MVGSTAISLPQVSGQFFEGYAASDLSVTRELIAQVVTGVRSPYGQYGWYSDLPRPEERAGDPKSTALAKRKLEIPNKVYDNNVEFDEYDVDSDQTGDWMRKVQELGAGMDEWQFETLVDLLHAGDTGKAWDGIPFYESGDVRHFNNDLTASDTAKLTVANANNITPEEFPIVLLGIVEKMLGFKDTKGKMIHRTAKKFAVGVPTNMFASAMTGVHANNLAGGATNPVANIQTKGYEFSVYADGRFDALPSTLHVARADRVGSRALIMQQYHEVKIEMIGFGSEHTKKSGKIWVGSKYAGGFGYGSPANAARGTVSQ